MATRPPSIIPHRPCTLFRSYLDYFLGLLGRVTMLELVRGCDERAMLSDILQRLADLLTHQTTQRASVDQEGLLDISDTFDSLIVIDRRVDMITPLLTQLTYEGLIDEIIHIKNCKGSGYLPHTWLDVCSQPRSRSQHRSLTPHRTPAKAHLDRVPPLRPQPRLLFRKRNGNTIFRPQRTPCSRSCEILTLRLSQSD
jgi:Sec1 family protein